METAQVLALICATLTPGAMRSTSGRVDAPERRISSWLMTKTAAAVRASSCSFLETEVTCTLRSCSRLSSERPVWLQAEAAAAANSRRNRNEERARSMSGPGRGSVAEVSLLLARLFIYEVFRRVSVGSVAGRYDSARICSHTELRNRRPDPRPSDSASRDAAFRAAARNDAAAVAAFIFGVESFVLLCLGSGAN